MQQKCDRCFSNEDIAIIYENALEDLDSLDFTEWDPQDVMDISIIVAAVNVARKDSGQPLIALPPALHQKINEFAKKGMHKGRGRRHPRESLIAKRFKETELGMTADYALRRKEERYDEACRLLAEAKKTTSLAVKGKLERQAETQGIRLTGHNSAEDKAIEDAREWGRERFKHDFDIDKIRRAMSQWRILASRD